VVCCGRAQSTNTYTPCRRCPLWQHPRVAPPVFQQLGARPVLKKHERSGGRTARCILLSVWALVPVLYQERHRRSFSPPSPPPQKKSHYVPRQFLPPAASDLPPTQPPPIFSSVTDSLCSTSGVATAVAGAMAVAETGRRPLFQRWDPTGATRLDGGGGGGRVKAGQRTMQRFGRVSFCDGSAAVPMLESIRSGSSSIQCTGKCSRFFFWRPIGQCHVDVPFSTNTHVAQTCSKPRSNEVTR